MTDEKKAATRKGVAAMNKQTNPIMPLDALQAWHELGKFARRREIAKLARRSLCRRLI